MKSVKFAHLADVHLGFEQYNQSWRAEDFARAFREAIGKIIEEEVDFVVIAGDLFHRSVPNPRTIKEAVDSLSLLRNRDIPVFAVEGNHDKSARGMSIYHLLESLGLLNVLGFRRRRVESEYLESERVEDVYFVRGYYGDVEIVGDRHRTRWQLEKTISYLKPNSDRSILVLHQSVKEVVDVELKTAYELTLNDLPEAGYYAFGHIHIPRVYEFGGKFVAYPGCLERYDSREASKFVIYDSEKIVRDGTEKGFYIVENFKPRFVEVGTRNLLNLSIVAEDAEEAERKLLSILDDANAEDIVVGKISCGQHLDVKRITDMCMKKVRYAEIRCELTSRKVERVEMKREDEFFDDFELKLLETLKNEDEVDLAIELIKKHFGLSEDESGGGAIEPEYKPEPKPQPQPQPKAEKSGKSEKSEKSGKSGRGKTLLDFIE